MTIPVVNLCWYCGRGGPLTLKACCGKHPDKLVCADVENCRDYLLAQVRGHDDALAEPWDEAAETDHDRHPAGPSTAVEDASRGELLDALRAIQEALDIPHAATQGDGEIHDKIVMERLLHVTTMLNSLLGEIPELAAPYRTPMPPTSSSVAFSVRYLREKLAEHPATGYHLYSEMAADPNAFYARLRSEQQGGGHVDAAAPCGCPRDAGRPGEPASSMIRHDRDICTDPVVAHLGWYAGSAEAGKPEGGGHVDG